MQFPGSGWFARIQKRGVGEEFVGSYLYQVHLCPCLESNDYGRLLSGNNAHIKVKRFVCRSTSKLNGILAQHRCGKCDKKNCISLEICPGARCPGHPPRRQSSETHENRRRWPVMSDWRPAYSALSTDIGVSRMALHAGTSVPANTVRSATPTAVAKVAGSLGATPKSNALIP